MVREEVAVRGVFVGRLMKAGRLLMGTRTERRTAVDAEARAVTTRTGGYVVNIDAQRLADVARSAGPEVEMFLPCQLGTYLELGGTIAAIVGVATTDDRFDADTLSAFTLDEARRAEVENPQKQFPMFRNTANPICVHDDGDASTVLRIRNRYRVSG
ncbi:hypothetical protein V6S67_16870 [Arthrobacter sp. Soc17.1.1.1]|uniref:hypothetical protein n=1 Tax=Arthrobacter sp. Soc17.1.1.1 TaxID=3121277 RepID=UPI002FE43511